MENITLGPYAKMMGYFEDDQEFHASGENLLTTYEKLCETALWRMRGALSDDNDRKEVICYYAGVQALQAALAMYIIDRPDRKPDLESLAYYAREVSKLNFLPTNK